MSRSHKLAWASGFVDGDGFITIQNRTSTVNNKTYNSHYLRLGACQASEVPLKELQAIFGGTIRIKSHGRNTDGYKRLTQYVWTLSTKQAAEALRQMLPYLVHKREVALLAIEFQESLGGGQITPEKLTYRRSIQETVKRINSES